MKTLHLTLATTVALALTTCLLALKASGQATVNTEARLIAVLKSGAPQQEKSDACRELARLGTKEAVPVLAALLGDEQLSHMARYGLETIPSPAVDQALRDALGTVKGRLRAGVITSIGVRRDAKAVNPVSKMLQDADPDVADAAARALGSIATKDAAQSLEAALASSSPASKLAVCEGLFRCAEMFLKTGERRDAMRVYDHLRARPDAAHQIRAAALRGAILARGPKGVPLLAEAIAGTDWILANAAARTAMELRTAAVTKVLAAALKSVAADRQVLILQTLGKRADPSALPAVLAAAGPGDLAVRLAALRTVAEIGDAAAAKSLPAFTCDPDHEVAETARQALASLPGKKTDDIILAMLRSGNAATKQAALDLIARRRMVSAVTTLQIAATDTDPKVRAAALKQMAELGGETELPVLLAQLVATTDAPTLDALEAALGTLCTRLAQPDACAAQLITRMAQAKPTQQAALLRVLGAVGGQKALATARAHVSNTNPEIHAAALDALGDWPTPDVAPELLALARSLSSDDEKLACLRSYLRWAADSDVTTAQRLAMCKDATNLVQRDQEKRLLLAALGGIKSPDAIAQALPFLESPPTREEACIAVVNIAEKMAQAEKLSPAVIAALQKVATTTTTTTVTKRAQTLLDADR